MWTNLEIPELISLLGQRKFPELISFWLELMVVITKPLTVTDTWLPIYQVHREKEHFQLLFFKKFGRSEGLVCGAVKLNDIILCHVVLLLCGTFQI